MMRLLRKHAVLAALILCLAAFAAVPAVQGQHKIRSVTSGTALPTCFEVGQLHVKLGSPQAGLWRCVALTNVAATDWVPEGVSTGDTVLSVKTTVNMNTATPTDLYTCPANSTCVVTSVTVTAASTSLTTAQYSFGWNAGTNNDVVASAAHTELTGATLYTILQAKTGAALGAAAGVFAIKVNTLQGAAATTTIITRGFIF